MSLHDASFRLGLDQGKLMIQDGPFEDEAHTSTCQLAMAERDAVDVRRGGSAGALEGTMRFLMAFGGARVAPSAWASFLDAMTSAGVLVAAAEGAPGAAGGRLCVLRVASRRDVFKWAWRGLKLQGEGTCRVDPVKDCRMLGLAASEETRPCDSCSCSKPIPPPRPVL